jgi:hypothetical protein
VELVKFKLKLLGDVARRARPPPLNTATLFVMLQLETRLVPVGLITPKEPPFNA